MSPTPLAELLDLVHKEGSFIRESEADISASDLDKESAVKIIVQCQILNWAFNLFDSAGTEWPSTNLSGEFAPFRVSIRKPLNENNNLVLVTNTGFAEWLKRGHNAVNWQVARLQHSIVTHGRIIQPWGEVIAYQTSTPTKSPRSLVREYGSERIAPEDVRPWLLREEITDIAGDETAKLWIQFSINSLMNSLPNEIDAHDKTLKFKGPPIFSVSLPSVFPDLADEPSLNYFYDLQEATNWVFENNREAELRHGLFANEIARSAGGNDDNFQGFCRNIAASLDGAKVAYQISLADLGRDTLKMLVDLRKAITEETAKVTDSTKQLVTSVAGALAVSLALIAARINAAASHELVLSVMAVVIAYIGVVIYSGYDFIKLQRLLRKDWQPRLYRFLPPSEYEDMVTKPTRRAERTFFKVAWIGSFGIVGLAAIIFFGWGKEPNAKLNVNHPTMATSQPTASRPSTEGISTVTETTQHSISKNIPKIVAKKIGIPTESTATENSIRSIDSEPKDINNSQPINVDKD